MAQKAVVYAFNTPGDFYTKHLDKGNFITNHDNLDKLYNVIFKKEQFAGETETEDDKKKKCMIITAKKIVWRLIVIGLLFLISMYNIVNDIVFMVLASFALIFPDIILVSIPGFVLYYFLVTNKKSDTSATSSEYMASKLVLTQTPKVFNN